MTLYQKLLSMNEEKFAYFLENYCFRAGSMIPLVEHLDTLQWLNTELGDNSYPLKNLRGRYNNAEIEIVNIKKRNAEWIYTAKLEDGSLIDLTRSQWR